MTPLEAIIAFLAAAEGRVQYQGPDDLGDGVLSGPVCSVTQVGPGGGEIGPGERTVRYNLRFYGGGAATEYDAAEWTRAATFVAGIPGVPKVYVAVGDFILKWFVVDEASGPVPEPETERPVMTCNATAKWLG